MDARSNLKRARQEKLRTCLREKDRLIDWRSGPKRRSIGGAADLGDRRGESDDRQEDAGARDGEPPEYQKVQRTEIEGERVAKLQNAVLLAGAAVVVVLVV